MGRSAVAAALLAFGVAIGAAVLSKDPSPAVLVAQAPPTATAPAPASAATPIASAADNPGFYAIAANLSPQEQAGREIWYKATAGNARLHTYVFQQRVNVLIDWYRVLNAKEHADR